MLVFGVVSSQTEKAVELFVRREDAEAMIRDVAADDGDVADELRVEAIELRLLAATSRRAEFVSGQRFQVRAELLRGPGG